MFRYLAFTWDPAQRSHCDSAHALGQRLHAQQPQWRQVFSTTGLQVYCTGESAACDAQLLPDGCGVLLGTLFEGHDKHDLQARPEFRRVRAAQLSSTRLIASAGRCLVDDYWGRYVALLVDAHSPRRWVLRDPMGGIPCFQVQAGELTVYCTSLEDCHRFGVGSFSINWEYLAADLALDTVRSRLTALREVTEVYRGECIALHGTQQSRSLYWHPFTFTQSPLPEDHKQAARALRRIARACVHAWSTCHSHLLVRLSGGLDSAIVLGCLHEAAGASAITCVNYYTHSFEGDERRYARSAAARAGRELVERNWSTPVKLSGILDMPHSAYPAAYWGWLQLGAREVELADSVGATALFGGDGGDQLFFQNYTELTAADYAQRHGVGAAFFEVALHAARASRLSMWRVLRGATRYGLLRQPWQLWRVFKDSPSIIADDAKLAALKQAYALHPWFTDLHGVPPGKLWHSYSISSNAAVWNPLDQNEVLDRIEPLMLSQPLAELCLRIPTYLLTMKGAPRYLARGAFSGMLPTDILQRHTKGGPRDGVKESLTQNRGFVRELLLDGLLVEHGLIDRQRLSTALCQQPTTISFSGVEILKLLSAEAWLRRWHAGRHRAAA